MRVIFFIHSDWAFGSIHYDLCKFLRPHGIYADVLPWENKYSTREMIELSETVDCFVTSPHGYRALESYSVPDYKIKLVAHGVDDINQIFFKGLVESDFAVVSSFLQKRAKDFLGIKPSVVRLGVDTRKYEKIEPAKELKTLGFASKFVRTNDPHSKGKDIKRGYLAQEVADKTGLTLSVAESYHNTFVTMPGFYKNVDCVLIPSTEEGGGLPALEAAAAGRLVIGTNVGHWEQNMKRGCITVGVDHFVNNTTDRINHLLRYPKTFETMCNTAKEMSANFDWEEVIQDWVMFIVEEVEV